MTRTNIALIEHVEHAQADAKAVESHVNQLLTWAKWPVNLEDITAHQINHWIMAQTHLSPSTIGTRLSVLKQAMARAGVAWPYGVKMPPRSKRPKWVLSQEQQDSLMNAIMRGNLFTEQEVESLMIDYILFITETGLRVEEALRVHDKHVLYIEGEAFLEVIGTKTAASYDIVPLSRAAWNVIERRSQNAPKGSPVFAVRYGELADLWADCMKYLNVTDKSATLKSLRRTFASRMAAKGCPAPILQKLMRHGSLATTSHYTNTIGMHEAARQWVS